MMIYVKLLLLLLLVVVALAGLWATTILVLKDALRLKLQRERHLY